jgi:hypothetical protein
VGKGRVLPTSMMSSHLRQAPPVNVGPRYATGYYTALIPCQLSIFVTLAIETCDPYCPIIPTAATTPLLSPKQRSATYSSTTRFERGEVYSRFSTRAVVIGSQSATSACGRVSFRKRRRCCLPCEVMEFRALRLLWSQNWKGMLYSSIEETFEPRIERRGMQHWRNLSHEMRGD